MISETKTELPNQEKSFTERIQEILKERDQEIERLNREARERINNIRHQVFG